MGLLSSVTPSVNSLILALINDPLLKKSIVYKRFSGQGSFDPALGYPVDSYDSISCDVMKLQHNAKSLKLFGLDGSVQVGDLVYVIRYSDLITSTNGLVKENFGSQDIILVDGAEQHVDSIKWIFEFAAAVSVIS
jgi:hypothetical protein